MSQPRRLSPSPECNPGCELRGEGGRRAPRLRFQRANPAPSWLGGVGRGEIKGLYQTRVSWWLHGVPVASWGVGLSPGTGLVGGHRLLPSSPSRLCKLSQDETSNKPGINPLLGLFCTDTEQRSSPLQAVGPAESPA